MEKKVILITGASGGMGKHMVSWFKDQEYSLILHYHDQPLDMKETDSIRFVKADLRVPEQIEEMAETALGFFGRIDVLINNAGVSKSSMSWKMELEDWKETMAINLDAPFLLSKALIPSMRAQNSGRIINISSVVAQTGAIGTAAYAASKAGLIGLTKTVAKELAANGISVNSLALGYFNTGMIDDVPADLQEAIIQSIPQKKLGDPKAVCKTIEWLISEEASYVTGQVLNINGGMYV